jgi:hypothetical protein
MNLNLSADTTEVRELIVDVDLSQIEVDANDVHLVKIRLNIPHVRPRTITFDADLFDFARSHPEWSGTEDRPRVKRPAARRAD